MAAKIIDGKALAAQVRDALRPAVAALVARGARPGLAAIIAGDDPASHVYVRNKVRACEEIGVRSESHALPAHASEAAILGRVAALNADVRVHGIVVQLPLPRGVNAERVLAAVSPAKDVDGFHADNLGLLLRGNPRFVPCTPAGVMRLLEQAGVPLAGRRAVVIGRSNIVGKPLALLLLQKDATVTICHSKTAGLAALAREADVLVAAAGAPGLVGAEMVKPGACVVDVGIHRSADGKLVGDVDAAAVAPVAGWLTPVPGGVGPMTVAMLVANTVRATEIALGQTDR
ncbi:MAG: bifunctional methylenetetrahydrofolate dehydrogenase/methenyltetrahydrofolate cyclohydrolase FolD [Betaproteobacteria bacterium]|nr:bifunctional methylenetetrahydrofolate dehydrogenase/methenyltetrahydrofolate cyclohydrolase FolD [Betaproteobacteria bacterium]MDH4324541.1 bifunctional methylenetetrahydrofolate dehydrogenase/methenyltetrahydrofolate cyclohydrolase FolD [Betaproteobacteria bacterium]